MRILTEEQRGGGQSEANPKAHESDNEDWFSVTSSGAVIMWLQNAAWPRLACLQT